MVHTSSHSITLGILAFDVCCFLALSISFYFVVVMFLFQNALHVLYTSTVCCGQLSVTSVTTIMILSVESFSLARVGEDWSEHEAEEAQVASHYPPKLQTLCDAHEGGA